MTLQDRLAANSYKGPGFDRIRLIAAMIVVLHHCSTYVNPQIGHDALFQYSKGFLNFGLFAVTVFFALSGFLVTPSLILTGDTVTFIVHRTLRIMPALMATVLVAMFIIGPSLTTESLKSYFTDEQIYRYSKNLLFHTANTLPGVKLPNGDPIIVNGALWTLYFEVLCYASLVLMSLSGVLARRGFTFAVTASVYLINALLWYSTVMQAAVPSRIETFISLFVYFASGVCMYRFASTIPWSAGAAATAAISMVVGLPLGIGVVVMPISIPYLVVYFGLSKMFGQAPHKRDYSYGIYVFHAQVLTFMLVMFPSLRNFWVATPVVAIISVSIAMLSWKFVEAPALRSKGWVSAHVRQKVDWIHVKLAGSNQYGAFRYNRQADCEPRGFSERFKKIPPGEG
jgi:peptidoglycan/LPS O-acetylase OafA/YrhL